MRNPVDIETDSRREELAELVGALGTEPNRPARIRRRTHSYIEYRENRRRQHLYLGAAIAVLLAGSGWLLFTYSTMPEESDSDVLSAEVEKEFFGAPASAEELKKIHALSIRLESNFPTDQTARELPLEPKPDFTAERKALLERLAADGLVSEFIHPSQLKRPAGGAPLSCYVLLLAPLDPDTELAWQNAGMLRYEAEVISPLLRFVVLDSDDAVRQLINPTVESVTYELTYASN